MIDFKLTTLKLLNHAKLLAVALIAISPIPLVAQDRLRVGVWNIEKLSTTAKRGFPELQGSSALPPRTDSDLQKMAEYILDELQVDALMVDFHSSTLTTCVTCCLSPN